MRLESLKSLSLRRRWLGTLLSALAGLGPPGSGSAGVLSLKGWKWPAGRNTNGQDPSEYLAFASSNPIEHALTT